MPQESQFSTSFEVVDPDVDHVPSSAADRSATIPSATMANDLTNNNFSDTVPDNVPHNVPDNGVFTDNDVTDNSPLHVQPLSMTGHEGAGRPLRLESRKSQADTMSVDQMRSSLLMHVKEIKPEEMIDRLVYLVEENRKLRRVVARHNDALEQTMKYITNLKKDKNNLEVEDKKNFEKTKTYIAKLRQEMKNKETQCEAQEKEIEELRHFRVESAKYHQQLETAKMQIKEQEEDVAMLKTEKQGLKEELEKLQESHRGSCSSEPNSFVQVTPEGFLELVDSNNQLRMEVDQLQLAKAAIQTQSEEIQERLMRFQYELDMKKASEQTLRSKMAEMERMNFTKEKEMEKELMGLGDTIKEYREENSKLKLHIQQIENQNKKLIEEETVKDLMDGAQVFMQSQQKESLKRTMDPSPCYASLDGKEEGKVYMNPFSYEGSEVRIEDLMFEIEAAKKRENELKAKLNLALSQKGDSSLSPQSASDLSAAQAQVVSLINELEQAKVQLSKTKETEKICENLKTQKEMDDFKNRSEVAQLHDALRKQMERLNLEHEELSTSKQTIVHLQNAKEQCLKELAEKHSIIVFLQNQAQLGGEGNSDQQLLFADQEVKRLGMEVDRLTAQVITAEDAINQKDEQLSMERKETAKCRAKIDDISMLQAQVQVYKEDFNQERQAREKMAQEKEMVLQENQQLQDHIAQLNDVLQAQSSNQFNQLQLNQNQMQRSPSQIPIVHQRSISQPVSQSQTLPRPRNYSTNTPPGRQTMPPSHISPNRPNYTYESRENASLLGGARGSSPNNHLSTTYQQQASRGNMSSPRPALHHSLFPQTHGSPLEPSYPPSHSPFVVQTQYGSPSGNGAFALNVAHPTPLTTDGASPRSPASPGSPVTSPPLARVMAFRPLAGATMASPPLAYAAPSSPTTQELVAKSAMPRHPSTPRTSVTSPLTSPLTCPSSPPLPVPLALPSAATSHPGSQASYPTSMSSSQRPSMGIDVASLLSLDPEEVSDEWQLLHDDQGGVCPKCQLRVMSMDLLQMHVLDCLDN